MLARCSDLFFQQEAKKKKLPTQYIGDDRFEGHNPSEKEFEKVAPILKKYYKEAFELLGEKKKSIKKESAEKASKTDSKAKKDKSKPKRKSSENYFVYGKLKGDNRFSALDYSTGNTVGNLMYASMFSVNQLPKLKKSLNKIVATQPTAQLQIRNSKGKVVFEAGISKKKSKPKKQLSFRLNGSRDTLVYLGVVEKLTIDGKKPIVMEGANMMFSNQAQNTLYILPTSAVKKVDGVIDDESAERLFKQWHNYNADNTDLELDFPSTEEIVHVGTANQIFYISDKVMRPGDTKGKNNYYKHDFDTGKRPVKVQGNMLIVENIKWNERGILN